MKKLVLALLVVSSVAYAADDCSGPAQKVVSKMHDHSITTIQLNYSSDQAAKATSCQTAITGLDKSLTVKMNPVSGTGVFKFQKPN